MQFKSNLTQPFTNSLYLGYSEILTTEIPTTEIPTSELNTTTEAIELTTITEEPGW